MTRIQSFINKPSVKRYTELVLNAILIVLVALFMLRPLIGSVLALQQDKAEIVSVQEMLQTKQKNIQQAKQVMSDLEPFLGVIEEAVPETPKQFNLLNQVRIIAEGQGLSIQRMQHKAGTLQEVEFTVTVDGSYVQVLNFLRILEDMPRLIQLDTVRIDATAEGTLESTITGKGYYYGENVDLLTKAG